FQPVDELERNLLECGERKLVIVELGPVPPRNNAGNPAVEALAEHDHALVVERRDVDRTARISRVRRIRVHDLAVGNADEIGPLRPAPRLDPARRHLLAKALDHGGSCGAAYSAAPARSFWRRLNSCSWRATIPR